MQHPHQPLRQNKKKQKTDPIHTPSITRKLPHNHRSHEQQFKFKLPHKFAICRSEWRVAPICTKQTRKVELMIPVNV